MSILIEDMEKPRHCYECRFLEDDLCRVLDCELRSDQMLLGSACPLIEISIPHGRLIDADALLECIPNEEINSKMAVAYAPTIIESEE